MTIPLHLRRIRVVEVTEDLPERLTVQVEDTRSVVRCPHCGFKTRKVHDRRRVQVADLTYGGRPTTLVWLRRRFACPECGERHLEDHPELLGNRLTWVTRRLARTLVRDVNRLSVRELSRRWGLGWHFMMALVASWSALAVERRRRRPCRVLMVDETHPAFAPEVFKSRYLQLARWDRLSDEAAERLGRILAAHPELEAAWRLLQHLYGIHLAEDDQGANRALGAFLETYESEPLPEFEAVVEALLKRDLRLPRCRPGD